jgi:tetratricopeptide (TPR) repeat protein
MNRQRSTLLVAIALCLSLAAWSHAQTTLAQQAQEAIKHGAFDQAVTLTAQLLKANPRDLNALNLRGLALTGRGELVKAVAAFEEALRVDPTFQPARRNLAINQFTLKRAEAAEKNFTLALKAAPRDPVLHAYLGTLAFRRKAYAPASVHLLEAKALWPKDARLPAMLAECDYALNRPAEALARLNALDIARLDAVWQFHAGALLAGHQEFIAATPLFEAARAHYPKPGDVLFDLGLCYVETKRFEQAIAVLNELRASSGATSELDNLLAEAYEGNKQTQLAIDLLRDATKLAPREERNYLDLAMLCAEHKAYDLGIEVVQVGLHYLPDSDALFVQRAIIYAMNGRYDESERDFRAASHQSTVRDSAYTALGLSYIQQGDVGKAVDALRERARADSGNAALQYLLGEALIRTGIGPDDAEYAEALTALEKSVRLNPSFVYSRIDLAKLYLMRNRNRDAIGQLRDAIAIDPTKVQAFAQLGAALRKEGKLDEAAPMFAKVRELNEYNRRHGEPVPLLRGSDSDAVGALK